MAEMSIAAFLKFFTLRRTSKIILRSLGTPVKTNLSGSVEKTSTTSMVSRKNATLTVMVRMPPLQTGKKTFGVILMVLHLRVQWFL